MTHCGLEANPFTLYLSALGFSHLHHLSTAFFFIIVLCSSWLRLQDVVSLIFPVDGFVPRCVGLLWPKVLLSHASLALHSRQPRRLQHDTTAGSKLAATSHPQVCPILGQPGTPLGTARSAARGLPSAPLSPLGKYAISLRARGVIRRPTKLQMAKIKRSVMPQATGQHPSRWDPLMADPLSLAASVVALVHAVRVGGKELHKLRSYYHAPPEIARLRAQMDSLGQLLDAVQIFVQGDNSTQMTRHSSDLLGLPVEIATARVASVNKILNSTAFGLSHLSDANKARATLFRYKSRLGTLEREIKESISEIGVRLSFVTA